MSNEQLLITSKELAVLLQNSSPLHLFDCRFDLKQALWGHEQFIQGHIPSAVFIDLDHDLSGPKNPKKGRHPLPHPKQWMQTRLKLGIALDDQVIIYDQAENIFSARMWWMLKATGHTNVQLLNGGFADWQRFGGNLEVGEAVERSRHEVEIYETPFANLVLMEDLQNLVNHPDHQIIDARAPERFKGEVEPLDPVAGHIPGAKNRPYQWNLEPNQLFKPADVLKREFEIAEYAAKGLIHQCGSGVTACHNLFAMTLAGLNVTKLYAGGWSEWCNHPENPVATGN